MEVHRIDWDFRDMYPSKVGVYYALDQSVLLDLETLRGEWLVDSGEV